MKKHLIIFFVLSLLLAACTPVVPAAQPEQADSSSQKTVKTTGETTSPKENVASDEETGKDLQYSPAQLEAWMQTSVLVVKWNDETRRNEIIPVETASAKTPPGAGLIVVGKEFIHAFSPDGRTLAIVASRAGNFWDSVLHWVDVPTWTHRESSLSFTKWVSDLVFSPDGKFLLIIQWPPASGNKPAEYATLTLVDVASQSIVAETDFPYRPEEVSFSEKGLAVYAVPIVPEVGDDFVEAQAFLLNLKDFSIRWQASLTGVEEGVSTKQEGEDIIHTFLNPGVVSTPDGRSMYIVHADEDRLTTVDFENEQVSTIEITPKLSWLERLLALTAGVAHAKMSDGIHKEAALSPDGSRLYVVGRVDDAFKDDAGNWQYNSTPYGLQVIDPLSGTEIARTETDASSIIGLSPDGSRLYLFGVQGSNQTVVIDTITLELVKAMDSSNIFPVQTMDGSLFALFSRTNSSGRTTMTVMNPKTLGMMVEWVEPGRTHFLSGQVGKWEAKGDSNTTQTDPEKMLEGPPENCPVTLPSEPLFTPPPPYPPTAPYGNFWYGTEDLWLMLPPDGTWAQLAIFDKMFWWREGYVGSEEPQPELTVTGRRLDADAPTVEVEPPATNAYHADFDWAMLAGVSVPTPGCWEITGHYKGHELSFVVWVAP